MAANYEKARRAARDTLARFGMTTPPFDPEAIAEAMNVNVVYGRFAGGNAQEIAGFLQFDPPRIVVNLDQPSNRKTFTIAHELGHYILHQDYAHSQNYQVMPRNNYYDGLKPDEEKEADVFAANLLVPMKALQRYRDVASTKELARLFAVSEDVILNRLKSS